MAVRFGTKRSFCIAVMTVLVIESAASRHASATHLDYSSSPVTVFQETDVLFTFIQQGFSEDAVVIGSFFGIDLDLNGHLSSGNGEIWAFAMMFSGHSHMPPFTLGLDGYLSFEYDVDGGPLGDGLTWDEGIVALKDNTGYIVGPGCGIGLPCTVVFVPEPGIGLLCATALAGLIYRRLHLSARRRLSSRS
jgi:hypothetical protein